MYRIDTNEKKKVRYLLEHRGHMGGFIQEETVGMFRTVYPVNFYQTVREYCGTGSKFLRMTDVLEKIMEDIGQREHNDADLLCHMLRSRDEFETWYLQQSMRWEEEERGTLLNGEAFQEGLSAFEAKLVQCYAEQKLEPGQIAGLMQCEQEEYIGIVLQYIALKLKRSGSEIKELERWLI